MPFYQNVFDNDFIGHLLLEDRQYVLDFKVPANKNKTIYAYAWAVPPYNTVGNTSLTINYSIDAGATWYAFSVNVGSGSAKTPADIAAALNADSNFTNLFTAQAVQLKDQSYRLMFQANSTQRERFKFYISNTGAETVLRFNQMAGVAELPNYFDRHTIANFIAHGPGGDNTYPDSQGCLVKLTTPTDNFYISAAGLDPTVTQADWQLLRGRSRAFMFHKNTIDGSNRITQTIEYPAGAKAGDLAKKITYTYSGTNTNPDQMGEVPYVLTSGDLITP
jgi:hypothetical protein